jgi:hypothetical protein
VLLFVDQHRSASHRRRWSNGRVPDFREPGAWGCRADAGTAAYWPPKSTSYIAAAERYSAIFVPEPEVRRVGASTDRGLAFSARLGTIRSTIDPRLDQLTKQRLIAGSGFASRARLPSPSYEVIVCEMFVEQRQIAPAVPIAIFELLANLSDRLALPRHLDGRHHPARMARNALIRRPLMQGEVAVGMAGNARHIAQHERLVGMNVIGLGRPITSWMAI